MGGKPSKRRLVLEISVLRRAGYIRKVQPEPYCLAHGYAKTREGAMAAFAKSWRRE
jgi:hypothetical protein